MRTFVLRLNLNDDNSLWLVAARDSHLRRIEKETDVRPRRDPADVAGHNLSGGRRVEVPRLRFGVRVVQERVVHCASHLQPALTE